MKTAILTGASSGLGIQFARQLKRVFPEVEELWLIARRQDRLEALAAELTDLKTVVLPLDLCREESFAALREKLAAEQPEVVLLLNNATAVCPGPMATEFVTVGGITGNSPEFERLPYCDPQQVALSAMTAAKHGHVFYTPTAFYKFYRVAAKLLPHALVVRWAKCGD